MTTGDRQYTLPQGYVLHWYEIRDVLGQGSFGVTYLAHDKNLNRQVAIKEYLPLEFAARDQGDGTIHPLTQKHDEIYKWGLDSFMLEAKTLARFNHPNIVRVYSVFDHNNSAYMAMEYEQGEDLTKFIKRGELTSETELLSILVTLLDGLQLVHTAGFIHRDIKPSNIYIRDDHSPVLLDFGSARHALGSRTRALTTLFTPGYAPFEQYHDVKEHQGPWTDIYALGATAYFAIAGKPPLDALVRSKARLSDQPDPCTPAVEAGAGRYSTQFLAAIDRALMFKEGDRPQNAEEWKRMLTGEVSVDAIEDKTRIIGPRKPAKKPKPIEKAAAGRKNRKIVTIVGTLIAVIVVVVTGFSVSQYVPSLKNKSTSENPPSSDLSLEVQKTRSLVRETLQRVASVQAEADELDAQSITAEQYREAHKWKNGSDKRLAKAELFEEEDRNKEALNMLEQALVSANQAYEGFVKIRKLALKHKEEQEIQQTHDEIKHTRSLIQATRERVLDMQAQANDADSQSHAPEKFREARERLTTSERYIWKADWFESKASYDEALHELNQALIALDQAHEGFVGAQLAALELQEEKDRKALAEEQRKQRNKYNKKGSQVQSAQKRADREQANADAVDTRKHAPTFYHEAAQSKRDAEKQIRKAKTLAGKNKYVKARTAMKQALSLLKRAQKGFLDAKNSAHKTAIKEKKPKPLTPQDKKIVGEILVKFTQAYQRRDLPSLERLSKMSPERRSLLKQIFQDYPTFEVSVSDLSFASDKNSATAGISIDKLIDKNGKPATPAASWKQTEVVVRRNGEKWGKVNW